jgi:hypothetical protein
MLPCSLKFGVLQKKLCFNYLNKIFNITCSTIKNELKPSCSFKDNVLSYKKFSSFLLPLVSYLLSLAKNQSLQEFFQGYSEVPYLLVNKYVLVNFTLLKRFWGGGGVKTNTISYFNLTNF